MRRMATALGTLGAAVALMLTVPNSAYAATGVLVIDGVAHEDPSGCFPLGDSAPPVVSNYTDAVAEVHSGPDCTGQVTWLIYPGETYHPNGSRSIFVL
ncbi:hypothetical protein GCM10010339_17370 [Streptomyces alanosinicus]|uniref:Secreted protein n=1 Tax=Streptomyces alanosinicus TaxID=68171 RepID=A0A919D152_9ACTN|nr:hypothetical protein GCM10010339_17370 [Streptomyces alanosinicus]